MIAGRTVSVVLFAAALGGCAQGSGLANLSLLQPGGAEQTASAETPPPPASTPVAATAGAAGGPPLPERNARRVAQAAQRPESRQSGGLSLAALADVKILSAAPTVSDASEWEGRPVAVYSQLAQQIRSCWLTPGASKLPGHGFHAEVAAGDPSEAKIILYEKAPDGKRGLQTYRLVIESRGSSSSLVKAENRKVDAKLDQTFKADLARWAGGRREFKS
jgi:hypothetical protein